ncbi:uncharacterized protein F5147DRAFT_781594 [Suillus discolor]|uniref:Uncharacterized protein n=1 Tax=Suillus discolor TaxID=1912936 RepID=A0A9P7ESC5_9AGAM|nr:uncharacterized protein F5147DRAFT_781594 [Suillus discolor]KAG2086531.1 hypothetical protein F5147DRAFT_781594 [Suillus discolor]
MPVAPFYESEGPFQALPLLMYHTEMFCPVTTLISISWQEEILFFPRKPKLTGRTLTPSRVFTTTSRAVTPIPSSPFISKVTKAVSFSAEQISQLSMGSSLSSIAPYEYKIAKPDGEAGHPGRGGYNLEKALKWDAGRFKAFKVRPHSINEVPLKLMTLGVYSHFNPKKLRHEQEQDMLQTSVTPTGAPALPMPAPTLLDSPRGGALPAPRKTAVWTAMTLPLAL